MQLNSPNPLLKALFIIGTAFLLSNCTTLESHSGGAVTASGQRIYAESTKVSVLYLTSMAEEYFKDFRIYKKLHSQCPDGKVTDIETTLWKRDWLLIQTYNLDATATCAK